MKFAASVSLLCAVLAAQHVAHGANWVTVSSFDVNSMEQIRNDWNIEEWAPGNVNNEREHYTDDGRTIDAAPASGGLVVTAYSQKRPAALHYGQDIQGNDLANFHGQPMSACTEICRQHLNCVAFSWNNYENGTCWLKTRFKPIVSNGDSTVGVMMDVRSGRLHSKQTFTPLDYASKMMRIEFTARVPTVMGAWPALWALGVSNVYGNWPQEGEIDLMEWVWQLQNDIKSSLHWAGGVDWSTDFTNFDMHDISSDFNTYGVELSAVEGNEYVEFYIKSRTGTRLGTRRGVPSDWKNGWHPTPPCPNEHAPCTPLAPFDNRVTLIINVAVGGDWGGCCGVNSYDAFAAPNGVNMTVSGVTVFKAV